MRKRDEICKTSQVLFSSSRIQETTQSYFDHPMPNPSVPYHAMLQYAYDMQYIRRAMPWRALTSLPAVAYAPAGMSFSLQSRDVIADSIETVMGGQWYDANIAIPGCDKNMPGCLIAMGRVNRPAIMVRLAGGGGGKRCYLFSWRMSR